MFTRTSWNCNEIVVTLPLRKWVQTRFVPISALDLCEFLTNIYLKKLIEKLQEDLVAREREATRLNHAAHELQLQNERQQVSQKYS